MCLTLYALIKFSWISYVGFLFMIIYVVSLYTQCLRYNICSTWILDIRISTYFSKIPQGHFLRTKSIMLILIGTVQPVHLWLGKLFPHIQKLSRICLTNKKLLPVALIMYICCDILNYPWCLLTLWFIELSKILTK